MLAGAAEDTGFLCRAYDAPDVKRASPFGSNFVFRAFLKNGFKEYAEKILEESCCFLKDGRSVFPEGTPIPRSECHIWSALPPAGLAVIFHGKDLKGTYRLGIFWLDLKDPAKVLYIQPEPILEPEEPYETTRGITGNCVYSCGHVIKDGRLIVYYGAADSTLCAASMPAEMLELP